MVGNVLSDDLLFKAYGADGIDPGPEALTGEVALLAAEFSGNGDSTLTFQEADHGLDCHFGRNLHQHVDMIWFEIAFDNSAVLLGCQGVKDLAQTRTNVAVQPVLPHLWDEDEMVLTVPLRV